jgi:hypothetical protein
MLPRQALYHLSHFASLLIFSLAVLELELKALGLLDKHPSNLNLPQPQSFLL